MNDILVYLIIAIIFTVIGFVIGKLLTKNNLEKVSSELEIRNKLLLEEKEFNSLTINTLNKEKELLSREKHTIDLLLNQKESELKNVVEKLNENKAEVEKLQEKFSKDFEILANKILDWKPIIGLKEGLIKTIHYLQNNK